MKPLASMRRRASWNSTRRITRPSVVLMDQIKRRALFRGFAIETLGRAGPPAAEAIPVLRDVVKHGSKQEREAARQALQRIEPKAGEKQ